MNAEVFPRLARLSVVLDRKFEDFDDDAREKFLVGLSRVTGCPISEMQNVTFRRGCVIAEIEMSEEAVKTFLDDYARAKKKNLPPALSELAEFLKAENVRSANAVFKVAIQIRSTQKSNQDVVFVHGWTGDKATFGELPKFLGNRLHCNTHIYEYPTGWLSHSPSIYFLAQNFDNWFRNYIHTERVGIIVHSMGGLIVRKFLTNQQFRRQPVDKRIKQLTFIASPHDGADLAEIIKKIPGLRSAQIEELAPHSGFIAELKDRWAEWVGQNVPSSCRLRSIYGTKDRIVSPPNAIGFDREAVPILGAGHLNITIPKNEKDDLVITIERFLHEAGFTTSISHLAGEAPSIQPSA